MFASVDTEFADSYMIVGIQVFKMKGKTITYLGDLSVLQKDYPNEDLSNMVDFQMLVGGTLSWIRLASSTGSPTIV